jgi:hypothetical protein
MKLSRGKLVAAVAAVVLAVLLPAGVGGGEQVHAAAAAPVSCTLSWTQATGNTAYPDTSATYWTVRFPVVTGGHLTIAGTFPHARYMSFNSYQGASAYDVVEDDILVPNGGALNPFQNGNPRGGTVSYDMTVAFKNKPASPASNTLYTGASSTSGNSVIYRVYVPDEGQDDTGGVGVPAVTFYAPAGTQLPPECTNNTYHGHTTATPDTVRPATATPTNPPTWVKATGNDSYGNLDNAYLSAPINPKFGQVLVIYAEAPTFPATYQGETTFDGDTQLRYWSMCENNPVTTGVIDCSPDYLTTVPSSNYYTFVVSKTQPTNATAACGVTWLPWGSVQTGLLILRNMLPSSSFTQSIQDAQPGHLQQDMGSYFPSAAYVKTVAAFEKLGCPPNLSGLFPRPVPAALRSR